ncbi:hypothetical protein IX332_000226 [Porphyromonas levii]|uniref:DUF3098 domain-containing protein n=1 Tax=Porphyromonas levii TaxID=28114 RepID=UPI001B8BF7BB|nr:DUF3098 domain-containing protein [Porphyromonas levii]MBR8728923.1 hypothetical protein [Porphyromonas levii]MBR8758889.1 hypothetical protein [Porphyromonas levii]MBR8784222.1 hypothetical protein [Porphyromonas levii]
MSKEKGLKTYGFTKTNLVILVASILLIVLGYILMAGGKSEDGVSFNPEVFSTMRIGVAPVVLTIGYIGILVAVLWRGKKSKSTEQNEEGSAV